MTTRIQTSDPKGKCQQAVKVQQSRAALVTHLKKASAQVEQWPVWKQKLLGGKAVVVKKD